MSRWGKFTALCWSDRTRLVIYSVLLPVISLGLKLFGYLKVYSFLAAHPPLNHPYSGTETAALQVSKHTASLVSVASRHGLYRATCLHQSLLIWWLIRRKGIQSDLRIGVRQRDGQFFAHAWVRQGEEVISEGTQVETTFSAFECLPLE